MAYESVDRLQNVLMKDVFHYTKDAKKAAGRALGTLVEIITFYLLKSWGFEDSIGIEKSLAEYGNPEITHNVEYTLHPVTARKDILLKEYKLPLTSRRIFAALSDENYLARRVMPTTNVLMTGDHVLRNSCVIGKSDANMVLAILDKIVDREMRAHIIEQFCRPYAMFECKRVGIEEGMKKGPQTIEKAKQGAYVAKSVSSLQKVRVASGEQRGLIYIDGNKFYSKPYAALVDEVVSSIDPNC